MNNTFLSLDDIKQYKQATELSDEIWEMVLEWDWFAKKTLGSQFVEAMDSIGANIAEGFGRYHKRDKQKFYYNSRGSTYESIYWLERAKKRNLLTKEQYFKINNKLANFPKDINWLIKITEEKLKK